MGILSDSENASLFESKMLESVTLLQHVIVPRCVFLWIKLDIMASKGLTLEILDLNLAI